MIIASFILRPSYDMSLTNTPLTKEQCSRKRRFVLYRFGSIWSMSGSAYYIAVKLIFQRFIKYLWKWSSINHYFIIFSHLLQEIFSAWPLEHVDVANTVINVYWNGVIRIWYLIELAVDQSLVQVKHQRFSTFEVVRLRTEKATTLVLIALASLKEKILSAWIDLSIRRWSLPL